MIHLLGSGTAELAGLPEDERAALFTSLSLTLGRADYHQQRFYQVIEALATRRKEAGGAVSMDTFAQYTMFEASAVLGAVRLGIDELIYITARLRGVDSQDIDKQWKAHDVLHARFTARPEYDLPEIRALRCRLAWYEELNDYRNVLLHRGWRTGIGGYYPKDSGLPEAMIPTHNAMLVPDRASLLGKTRSHQWTYSTGRRLENVVDEAVAGFHDTIDLICMSCWGGVIPQPGTAPKEHHPDIMVSLVRPVLLVVGNHLLLAVFTDPSEAAKFNVTISPNEHHLQEVLPTTMVVGQPAFTIGLPGIDEVTAAGGITGDLIIALNPCQFDARKMSMETMGTYRHPLSEVRKAANQPISLPAKALGVERLFVWRPKPAPS